MIDIQTVDYFCPYMTVTSSTLSNNNSQFVRVSCDEKDTWINGILENSRHGLFHIFEEKSKLKVALISKGLNTLKFRKCTVKSEAEALLRIKTWTRLVRGLTP